MEIFTTVQGEGYHRGRPACFVRLAGCDVGCTWCDTRESWSISAYPEVPVSEIVRQVSATGTQRVVVTGGEPLMHNLDTLTRQLKAAGCTLHLETSGAYPVSGQWDWVCLSPKKFKNPLPEVIRAADELKVIVYHPSDLHWAEIWASQVSPGCHLFLQPEWGRQNKVTPMIVEYLQKHPGWSLSVQEHKYLNLP